MRQTSNLNKVCNEPNDRTLSLSLFFQKKWIPLFRIEWKSEKIDVCYNNTSLQVHM